MNFPKDIRPDIEPHLELLYNYAKNASFIIELGVDKGNGSTAAFVKGLEASALEDKLMISVDIEDTMLGLFKPQQDFWHFIEGDSQKQVTVSNVRKLAGARKADILFIDTVHNYDFIKKELPLWLKMTKKSTIWLFHDTWMLGQYNYMTDAIKEFCPKTHKYVDLTKESNGIGALLPINK